MEVLSEPNRKDLMVEMRGITKIFPGVIANSKVDLDIRRGEIHALLGENGAGKSTLMNVLYGLYSADEGEMYLKGKKLVLNSPVDAISKKIGMIHQHFMLIPKFTVVENIALCLEGQNLFKSDLKKIADRILYLSQKYGLEIDPWAKVKNLSVGAQQRVEILKVLYRGAEVLIMDEPTAVLTPNECETLFKVLKDIAEQGNSIIFISHKLWEVIRLSHRVTVLRDGAKIETVNTKDVTKEMLANMMVGREVILQYKHPQIELGPVILDMKEVSCYDDIGIPALDGLSLKIHGGEVVGIAGVDGNGQKELAEVIHGLRKVTEGQISLNGKDITNMETRKIIDEGLGHIPEDRLSTGVVLEFSVAENIALIDIDKEPYTKHGIYSPSEVFKKTLELKDQFDIKTAGINVPLKNLSGGNQQKVVLAREISRSPALLIAAQPSRGLDIGATEFTQKTLISERTKGKAVLLISTDLDEVLSVSDRVLVIYEGKIMGEFVPGQLSIEKIGLLMAGSRISAEVEKEV